MSPNGEINPLAEVKKYDPHRRVYLPRWVEEKLGLMPGESYVTFVPNGDEITIRKVSISLD